VGRTKKKELLAKLDIFLKQKSAKKSEVLQMGGKRKNPVGYWAKKMSFF